MGNLSKRSKIGILGAGIVGKSIAVVLSRSGYPVVATASRSFSSAQDLAHLVVDSRACVNPQEAVGFVDVIFVTTPDDSINQVVSEINWSADHTVIHCSGVSSVDVLEPASVQGAKVGSFHPMQAFASVENGVKSIPGTTFGIEGSEEVQGYLKQMALDVGGHPISLSSEDKALYHLSGVMMGGLLSGVAAATAQLWEQLGMERADGVRALTPMIRQVSQNLSAAGVPAGIAGPYARGDVGTVKKHLHTLKARAPDVLPLYCHMGLAGLPFALEKGTLSAERAEKIRDLLNEYLVFGSG